MSDGFSKRLTALGSILLLMNLAGYLYALFAILPKVHPVVTSLRGLPVAFVTGSLTFLNGVLGIVYLIVGWAELPALYPPFVTEDASADVAVLAQQVMTNKLARRERLRLDVLFYLPLVTTLLACGFLLFRLLHLIAS